MNSYEGKDYAKVHRLANYVTCTVLPIAVDAQNNNNLSTNDFKRVDSGNFDICEVDQKSDIRAATNLAKFHTVANLV